MSNGSVEGSTAPVMEGIPTGSAGVAQINTGDAIHSKPSPDHYDENELESILSLMKRRSSSNLPSVDIFRDTNALLKQHLLSTLLAEIKRDVEKFKATPPVTADIQWDKLRLKAEIVFFALYQTLATPTEAELLLALIRDISSLIAATTLDGFFAPEATSAVESTGLSTLPSNIDNSPDAQHQQVREDAASPLLLLLVILQLAHLGAHQQTVDLYSRDVLYSSVQDVASKSVDNDLPNEAGSWYGMDVDNWTCRGARAFTCLVFGVFRQPQVDDDNAEPDDVEWFLHEACVNRGYSYLRLCILPVIQSLSLIDRQTSLFYLSILSDLLENLSEIYRMSFYRSDAEIMDFPYIFFPPTTEFYLEHTDMYKSQAQQSSTEPDDTRKKLSADRSIFGGWGGGHSHSSRSFLPYSMLLDDNGVDTLQDVIAVHRNLMAIYPNFVKLFWNDDCFVEENAENTCVGDKCGADKAASDGPNWSEARACRQHLYTPHHFVTKVLSACQQHRSLWIPSLQYLISLAGGPAGSTARPVFFYLEQETTSPLHWSHLLHGIRNLVAQLSDDFRSNGKALNQPHSTDVAMPAPLVAGEIPVLLNVLNLLTAVACHPVVCDFLDSDKYAIVPLLFDVFSCSLPCDLKAAVLRTLSELTRHSIVIARKVLKHCEGYATSTLSVFSSPNSVTTGNHQSLTFPSMNAASLNTKAFLHSIRIELDERESHFGQYPLTEALLQLLLSTFRHGPAVQHQVEFVEQGGLFPYIDYVIDVVLLTVHQRRFIPSSESSSQSLGMRWRLAAKAMEVLLVILQQFPCEIAVEAFSTTTKLVSTNSSTNVSMPKTPFRQTTGLTTAAAPKVVPIPVPKDSPGFYLLTQLLGNSRLTDFLMQCIRGLDSSFLTDCRNEYFQSELTSVVDSLLFFSKSSTWSTRHNNPTNMRVDQMLQSLSANERQSSSVTSSFARSQFELSGSPIELLHTKRDNTIDSVFWTERVTALTVSILWQIAHREKEFFSYLLTSKAMSPSEGIVVSRYEGFRILPVSCVPLTLSSMLAGHDAMKPLLFLMQHQFRTQPVLPSTSVLIVQICEHLAVWDILSRPLFPNDPSFNQRVLGNKRMWNFSSTSSLSSVSSLNSLCLPSSIIETFVMALLGSDTISNSIALLNDCGEYERICNGATRTPLRATIHRPQLPTSSEVESSSQSTNTAFNVESYLANDAQHACTHDRADGLELVGENEDEISILRTSVLSLLLGTLSTHSQQPHSTRDGSFHNAGYEQRVESSFHLQLLGLSSSSATSSASMNCLDALLQLIHPLHTHFFQKWPLLAMDVYELLFRLAQHPSTMTKTLVRLRERDFFQTHLMFLLRLAALDVSEMVQMTSGQINDDPQTMISLETNSLPPERISLIASFGFAIRQSISWLLKICQLELKECKLHGSSVTHAHSTLQIISLLIGEQGRQILVSISSSTYANQGKVAIQC
jgi:hypothetical protein